jgi:hypothetical protein
MRKWSCKQHADGCCPAKSKSCGEDVRAASNLYTFESLWVIYDERNP